MVHKKSWVYNLLLFHIPVDVEVALWKKLKHLQFPELVVDWVTFNVVNVNYETAVWLTALCGSSVTNLLVPHQSYPDPPKKKNLCKQPPTPSKIVSFWTPPPPLALRGRGEAMNIFWNYTFPSKIIIKLPKYWLTAFVSCNSTQLSNNICQLASSNFIS